MAGLFDKQAEKYVEGRPTYPKQWYKMLADLSLHHTLAWDVGTGSGQAAVSVAEHYDQVIGTDISESQLNYAMPHPRVRYVHTPLSMTDNELVALIGGESSVDLITVAQAVHWFDLPRFYSIATRVLKKPGGVIAVWGYKHIEITPTFDTATSRWFQTTLPYWHTKVQYIHDDYNTLPFAFESVGLGSEGNSVLLDIPMKLSFEGYLRLVRSWSAIATAKEKGVDLVSAEVVKELEEAWGGADIVRDVVYKAFMLAGKVKD